MGVYPPAEKVGTYKILEKKKHVNFPSIKKQNCFDESENDN